MAAISSKLWPDFDLENFTDFSSRLMITAGLSSGFDGFAAASSLVTVMRLGCVSEAGGRRNAHISQTSTHSGLYAYEHFVQVHIRGGVTDSLPATVRFVLFEKGGNNKTNHFQTIWTGEGGGEATKRLRGRRSSDC